LYKKLSATDSVPKMLATLASGAAVMFGILICFAFIYSGFEDSLLNYPVPPADTRIWHIFASIVAVGLWVIIGSIMGMFSQWIRSKIFPKVSNASIMLALSESSDENLNEFLRERIRLAELIETLSISILIALLLSFFGYYFRDGTQLKDIEFFSITLSIASLSGGMIAISQWLLKDALRFFREIKEQTINPKI